MTKPVRTASAEPGPEPADAQAVLHRAGHRIALERVEAEGEGRDQRNRVKHRQPFESATQAVHDVLRRPAAIGALFLRALEDLRQRAFEQAGRHADQRDHPHPENRPGTAERYGDRHAGDVPAADPSPDADQQGFARADMLPRFRLAAREQHPEHAPEEAELHEPRSEREKDAEDHQERHERPSPGPIADNREKPSPDSCMTLPLCYIRTPLATVRREIRLPSGARVHIRRQVAIISRPQAACQLMSHGRASKCIRHRESAKVNVGSVYLS